MFDNTTIRGLPELKTALAGIVPKLRRRALRNALAAGARLVRDRARSLAPVLKLTTRSGFAAQQRGVRRVGTVRKAIAVRTSKLARRRGDVGVFVNVRPAKGAERGARKPNDPFYWRWLEFGWNPASRGTGGTGRAGRRARRDLNRRGVAKRKAGAGFLRGAAALLPAALQRFVQAIGPAIAKLNRPKAPAP